MMVLASAFSGLLDRYGALWTPVWNLVFAPALLFCLRYPIQVARNIWTREPFLLLLLALAISSTQWSLMPALSLRRALLLTATFVFAAYLAARDSWQELLDMSRSALRWGLILSLLLTPLLPDICLHTGLHEGDWRGLFVHKNQAGRVSCMLVILSLSALAAGLARRKSLAALDLSLGGLCLLLAHSRTSQGVALVNLALLLAGLGYRRSSASLRLGMASVATLSLGLFIPSSPLIYALLSGLDWNEILTGRVTLWRTVLYFASKAPWSGYGFRVFFEDAAFGPLVKLWEGWSIPNAHNAMLELAVDLGVGAVFLYLASMALFGWRALRSPWPVAMTGMSIGTFNLLTGLTEAACFPQMDMASLFFMTVALKMRVSRSAAVVRGGAGGISPEPAPARPKAPTAPETGDWSSDSGGPSAGVPG